jgi:hypothetical protein
VRFVEGHPQLAVLLEEARARIADCFGSEVRVALELVTDVDSANETELFALIPTDLPVDEASRRLSRLDEEWWLDAAPEAQGLLNIDVEHV